MVNGYEDGPFQGLPFRLQALQFLGQKIQLVITVLYLYEPRVPRVLGR